MSFWDAIRSCLKKFATFSGRAPRSEYWYWTIGVVILSFIASSIDAALFAEDQKVIGSALSVAAFMPGLSVTSRRLHDSGRSAKFLFLYAVPLVAIMVLAWLPDFEKQLGDMYLLVVMGFMFLLIGTFIWFFVLMTLPGTSGANDYGPNPLLETDAKEELQTVEEPHEKIRTASKWAIAGAVLVSLVLAFIGAVTFISHTVRISAESGAKIVVFTHPLTAGSLITSDDVEETVLTADALPEGAFSSIQELMIEGQPELLSSVEKSEPVRASQLSRKSIQDSNSTIPSAASTDAPSREPTSTQDPKYERGAVGSDARVNEIPTKDHRGTTKKKKRRAD